MPISMPTATLQTFIARSAWCLTKCVPSATWMNHLYLPANDIFDLETDYRAISHAQIELIAGRVSANNQCLY